MDQSERPRFFEGQYLGADDLSAGVDYARVQNARHLLAAHTWGIATGLDLVERTLPAGGVDVTITPGIAWDGYARPVVVLAPAKLPADKFANFQADTPPEGLLVKVWLRYDEAAIRGPAAGFENCRVDDQHERIAETFAIEVGEPLSGVHGTLSIAGRSVDALNARTAFNPTAPSVYDESVPYQTFPDGKLPRWLIPIGYVRWQKLPGQQGRIIARNNGATPPDSDVIRAFRRYLGVIADTINAADGVIRIRDRWQDPDPTKTHFKTPQSTIDPAKPPVNDLVWVEGHMRVVGDARLCGGKLEWRDTTGSDSGVPLAMRRTETNAQAGKDLQVVLGTDAPPTGKHALAIGAGKINATTGALELTKSVVVRDNGNVGIANETPVVPLEVKGEVALDKIDGGAARTLPTGTTMMWSDGTWLRLNQNRDYTKPIFGVHTPGVFAPGSLNVGGAGAWGDPGAGNAWFTGHIGVGTTAPQASVEINGDLALDSVANGTPRSLPTGGTMMWSDGTWLRLNQNRDYTKPIFGVHTPGVFGSGSLNVGGAGNWGEPGWGNGWFTGSVGIRTTTPAAPLDVAGRILRNSQEFSRTGTATNNGVVTVPWGTTDDWNIFVSPNSMGREEADSEFDNAMLVLECWASVTTTTTWTIRARYKFKFSNAGDSGNGTWFDGSANWLLVPR